MTSEKQLRASIPDNCQPLKGMGFRLVPGGGFSRNRFPQRMLSARCSVLRNLSLFGLPLSPI